jgi:F-type H+-transporting ATPase subunit alpha
MDSAAISKIVKEIEGFAPTAHEAHAGRVTSVGDGVVAIDGLSKAVMSEIVIFEETKGKNLKDSMEAGNPVMGLILNLEEDGVRAAILGDTARVAEGMTVKSTGKILSVPSGEELLGRVVSALGEPLDGKGPFKNPTQMSVEREAYGVIDRKHVSVPLQTGIISIDALIPA